MTEKRIDFETAKLAKEKGFNVTCGANSWITTLDGRVLHNSEREEDERCTHLYAQPTQSLLQQWIREMHKIHIEIELTDSCVEYFWEFCIVNSIDRDWNDLDCWDSAKRSYDYIKYGSYEKALEAALLESLKRIS